MGQHLSIILIEVHPDLNPIEGLRVLRRDESESINMLGIIEIFTHKVEDQIGIDFILIFLVLVDWENKSASLLVPGVFPLGLNAFLEILEGVHSSPFVLHQISAW
jgi:hypothetical protein